MQELFLKILARGGPSKPDRTEGSSTRYRPVHFRMEQSQQESQKRNDLEETIV